MKTIHALIALAALPAAALAQPMTGSAYVMKAGASDLYEKTSSQLVLASTDPKVRGFAQMMLKDHTKSTADVKAAAMKGHVRVAPPKLNAKQARDVAALRAARGADRDHLYVAQQKDSHQMALAVQQTYAANGAVAPLKMVAGKIVPVVQHHIEMLNAM